MSKDRVIALDVIRVVSSAMVIMVHSIEFYYIGPDLTILQPYHFWVNTYGSFLRCSVPLFIIISGYLLLPSPSALFPFYIRRFRRIIPPLLFWSWVYLFIPFGNSHKSSWEMIKAFFHVLVNFSGWSGHLWFVYMLIGLYLHMPVLSAWVNQASKRDKEIYLMIWIFSLFLPFIKRIHPEVLGEAFWNEFHVLYYFSGYSGYLLLGHYIKVELTVSTTLQKQISLLLIGIGYAVTWYGFYYQFPLSSTVPQLELTWRFTTVNVAMMATGMFLLMKDIKIQDEWWKKLIVKLSDLSYGVYLSHIVFLVYIYELIHLWIPWIIISVPIVTALTTLTTYLSIWFLSFLPIAQLIIG